MEKRFLFLGGDKRISFAAQKISQQYITEKIGLGEVYLEPMGRYDCIVLPLPATRDGVYINAPLSDVQLPLELISQYAAQNAAVFSGGTHPQLEKLCSENSLRLINYFSDETLTLKNALMTAQAASALLQQSTESALFGANAVITGFGRIAMYLARLLSAFGCNVTVLARRAEQRTLAMLEGFNAAPFSDITGLCSNADFVINTAPAQLFGEEHFAAMHTGAVFMELATISAEPQRTFAKNHRVQYIYASGLPGKSSPKTAGEAIAQAILNFLQEPFN